MSDDNTLVAARATLENEEVDEETRGKVRELLDTLTQLEATAADVDTQRNELKTKAQETSKQIEVVYAELLKLMPANPLGNLTVGMSYN